MREVNKLKQYLRQGRSVLGAFVTTSSANLVEMSGYAGFDFVVLDIEHGRFNIESLDNLIRAADCVDKEDCYIPIAEMREEKGRKDHPFS